MKHLNKIREMRLSQVFFWMFLVSLPINTRILYNPERSYIDGFFSYYLAIFLYLSDILLFLCLVSYIIEQKPKLSLFWVFLAFGLVLGLYAHWFHVKHGTELLNYGIVKVAEIILLVWYVARETKSGEFIKPIFWIIYISAVFQAILGIWQFHVQHGVGFKALGEYLAPLGTGGLAMINIGGDQLIRAYGTFPHPNILGAFLVFALILGYFLIVSRETGQKARIFIGIGDYLLIVGIFLTFSRISLVIAAFATLGFLWYVRGRTKWLILAILLPALIAVAMILTFWSGLVANRVTDIPASNSYSERVTLNEAGWTIFKENPLFGTGPGNYVPTMQEMFRVQPWEYQPSHNIFLYVGATFGILLLGLFVLILWKSFRSTWNNPFPDLRFTLLLLGISLIFISNFDHFLVTIQQGQLMLGLILGMMLANFKSSQTYV